MLTQLATLLPNWNWSFDGPIILAGALAALSCALLGNFLVLRKMSMMGDAISHAVLPGLALAFWITQSRDSLTMLIGAAVIGVLTTILTQAITHFGKVESGASMGVVFTSLFALGLILIRFAAEHVDLDASCVLYGSLESVALHPKGIPPAILNLSIIYAINLTVVLLLYKELKIVSFDPALATTLGINAHLVHYLLMILVAATTVACFEAVGSILVVAMLIVPAATALLLSNRLPIVILLSQILALASAFLGHLAAIAIPAAFNKPSTLTSGGIAITSGTFLLIAIVATSLLRLRSHKQPLPA